MAENHKKVNNQSQNHLALRLIVYFFEDGVHIKLSTEILETCRKGLLVHFQRNVLPYLLSSLVMLGGAVSINILQLSPMEDSALPVSEEVCPPEEEASG